MGRILYGASISHMGDPQGVIEMRQSLAGQADVLLAKSAHGAATAVGVSRGNRCLAGTDSRRRTQDGHRLRAALLRALAELQAWSSLLRLKQLTGETSEVKRELAQCLASFTEGLQSPLLRGRARDAQFMSRKRSSPTQCSSA